MSTRDEYRRIIARNNRYCSDRYRSGGYSASYQEEVNSMLVSEIDSLRREIEYLKKKLNK